MATTDMSDVAPGWKTQSPASAAPAAAARARDPRLDFYRGIAMFIILFAHTPGNFFTSWIPARWGFSDATEIFVFCSGMASAIAFGRVYDRAGWRMGTARVAYRVWQVYWAHIALFFTVVAILGYIDGTGLYEKNYMGGLNLWKVMSEPVQQIVGLFTLTYVPNYFDILPMYLVILCMMPVLMALSRIHLGFVFMTMGLMWLFAQGRVLEAFGIGHLALDLPAEPWSERTWFFNPFGWQLVFFTGFAFMRGWIPAPPVKAWLIALCTVIVVANIPLSNIGVREFGFDWARDWRIANRIWITKSDFGILRYVHFLSLAYLAWVAAGTGGHRLIATGATAASRLWDLIVRNVMKVGQQSLAVFIFSMVLARVIGFTFDQLGRDTWTVTGFNLVGMGLLIGVAYLAAWFKGQPWRQRKAT